jgi:hypothetical protein
MVCSSNVPLTACVEVEAVVEDKVIADMIIRIATNKLALTSRKKSKV